MGEMNNMQILLYGSLATGDDDILPGHIWVEREALEVQNMKYYCPTMLKASLQEQQKLIESYHRACCGVPAQRLDALLLRACGGHPQLQLPADGTRLSACASAHH